MIKSNKVWWSFKSGLRGRGLRVLTFLAVLMPMTYMCPTGGMAWWNEQWQYRKKISFDPSPTGADIKENLSEIPVLVRLHTGNFHFGNCKDNGEDIRFVSSDDKTPLKFHIERFDPLEEMAFVWVKLPRLSGGINQEYIYMYYGNGSAVGGQDSGGTYDANQVLVFHLGETEGPPKDATANANHASDVSATQGLPAVIGLGAGFNGVADRIGVAPSPSLKLSGGLTFSCWLKIRGGQKDAHLLSIHQGDQSMVVAIDQTSLYSRLMGSRNKTWETDRSTQIPTDAWHHVAVTAQPDGRVTLYLDGIETFWVALTGSFPDLAGEVVIGGEKDGSHGYLGDLDEVQLSNVVRSPSWIRAAYASQGPDSALCAFGEEEAGGAGRGLPVFYVMTVAKHISLDGWAIIGILAVMSLMTWFVFLSKAFFLKIMKKENNAFLDTFHDGKGVVPVDPLVNGFENSPLFRIYVSGHRELSKWVETDNPSSSFRGMSASSIGAVRSALDRGFVQETQKLNGGMVLMTMAITGGPFLGLLGTVWGVMNTFAAMAEAGEASIMAIAPGVASALTTTVAGLLVAIPALFAYNYLASGVKNLTSDLDLFTDQFVLRLEHAREAANEEKP
jgi:biopolymer transport protein ExbB